MDLVWLNLTIGDVAIERQQLLDEGRDLARLETGFAALLNGDRSEPAPTDQAAALLDAGQDLPCRADYPYMEPSDLAGIRAQRPAGHREEFRQMDPELLQDRLLGAWAGRCAGCLLGKPVEGLRSTQLSALLKEQDNFPLNRYITRPSEETCAELSLPNPTGRGYIDDVDAMPEDDDLNYTVLGLDLLRRSGSAFTPDDVAMAWLTHLPLIHVCTAERVAYRNFALGLTPPQSAVYRNPYREWIGAQIRADVYGYAALGNPERAAEWAWRDASISHVKNGIYGAMWVAAMIAAAPCADAIDDLLEVGLGEIPAKSRLAEAIAEVRRWHQSGITYDEAVARIHAQWNEADPHHWCHTISNAQIVAMALLWGDGDFSRSICMAVQPGFDTDCNGATVGSIIGLRLGAGALPEDFIGPMHDTLHTGLTGYGTCRISELAAQTASLPSLQDNL